jgi:NAD(P)H-hydrate epimerase
MPTPTPLPRLAPRPADSHKGDFGRALLVGGSRGMSGAIALSGMAALRGGAGLVTLGVPRTVQHVVASFNPCYMTLALDDNGECVASSAAPQLLPVARRMTAVAIGPGLGRQGNVTRVVRNLYEEASRPLVIDADGLFALAEGGPLLAAGPRILTPHPGEFARLAGRPIGNQSRSDAAMELARIWSATAGHTVVVVLKGQHTVITDGEQLTENQTGNPGMATGGTGDVLTGVITALLCQGLPPYDAARLGAHVHGLAGDLAAEKLGQVSLIATDLLDFLPTAFQNTT